MGKIFSIVAREGKHGWDFVVESLVTGEVFLLFFEDKSCDFRLFDELKRMIHHILEVRYMVKSGFIKFAGDQVIYCKVYV